MNLAEKMILPIKKNPSVITCIHHSYQCAVIESLELGRIKIGNYEDYKWNFFALGTNWSMEENFYVINAEENADIQDFVIWRECNRNDELNVYIKYVKPKDYGRCIDIFLFQDDLNAEINAQDKTSGFRWNPYGYFVKKDMYFYDTKIYRYMKVCIVDTKMICYGSMDGEQWEEVAVQDIDAKYLNGKYKIGIHAHFGKNYFKIWKNMNFIQLLYNSDNEWKGIHLDYYFFPRKNIDNGYGYYTNFLDTQYDTTYDVLDLFDTVQDYVKWNINHYYYTEICLDEKYVQERENFMKRHYYHYNLFYGYDDKKAVFYIMGYGSNHKPVVSELPYSAFNNEGFITSEKIVRFKYYANEVTDLKFCINSVRTAAIEFLNSSDSSEKIGNLISQEPVIYGIDILKVLATEENKHIYSDRRISFCILEHSRLMRERLDYLFDNGYFQNEDYIKLIEQNEKIIKKATIILNLVMKGMLMEKEYPKVVDYLYEIYDLEKEFFEDFLAHLESIG